MSITKEKKKEVIEKMKIHPTDTGSAEVQVGIMTERINRLTEHFRQHKKDNNSRRGLLQLIGQRRRLLKYIKAKEENRYQKIIKELGLRK